MDYPLNQLNNGLRIVTYNVFCRPHILFKEDQHFRSEIIPKELVEQIKNVDVFIFCEVFDSSVKDILVNEFKKYGYYFNTETVGENKKPKRLAPFQCISINGGVFIISKYPLMDTDTITFSGSEIKGTDAIAAKGVLYTKLYKPSRPESYHIFATHLCAWDKNHYQRIKELERIKKYIDSKSIPSTDIVIVGGDLNINYHNHDQSIEMNDTINTFMPPIHSDSISYTHDPRDNMIASRVGKDRKWLDYILISKEYKQPSISYSFTFPISSPSLFLY